MTGGPRITLRIGRITGATEGLSRAALERALHSEIARVVAAEGPAVFGAGSARAHAQAAPEGASGDRTAALAASAVRAIRS